MLWLISESSWAISSSSWDQRRVSHHNGWHGWYPCLEFQIQVGGRLLTFQIYLTEWCFVSHVRRFKCQDQNIIWWSYSMFYRYWPNNSSRMYVLENTGEISTASPNFFPSIFTTLLKTVGFETIALMMVRWLCPNTWIAPRRLLCTPLQWSKADLCKLALWCGVVYFEVVCQRLYMDMFCV